MQWIETDPIPEECKNCTEEDCYNFDTAGKRWMPSREDALLARRRLMIRAIQRLLRKIAAIDQELQNID